MRFNGTDVVGGQTSAGTVARVAEAVTGWALRFRECTSTERFFSASLMDYMLARMAASEETSGFVLAWQLPRYRNWALEECLARACMRKS